MSDSQDYLADPEFHTLSLEARKKILSSSDADFAKLSPAAQDSVLNQAASKFTFSTPPPKTPALKPLTSDFDKPLFSYPGVGPSGYREDAAGVKPKKTTHTISQRDLAEQLPNLGAMATTAAFPEVAIPARLGLAFLGGAGGSLVQQGTESLVSAPPSPNSLGVTSPAGRAGLSGVEQVAFEVPGLLAKGLAKYASSKLPTKPDEKLAESVSESLGLNLKPQEIAPKLSRKEEKLLALSDKAEKNVSGVFGTADTPHEAGTAVYNATQRASEIAHGISRENYGKLQGLTVDLQPHSDTILSLPPSLLPPDLADKVKSIAELRANRFPEKMVKDAEKKAFGTVDFSTVQDLRTAVREASELPPGQALMANAPIGKLKLANSKLSAILDDAAKSQGKGAEWSEANKFHRGIGDLFERGLGSEINRTGLRDPHKIISLIAPHDIKAVRDMKAIFAYAQRSGNPVEAAQALTAQRKFQRGFLDQKILDLPVEKWKTQIDKQVGRDVLAEVLGDPEAEKNLYAIATTAGQIAPDSKLLEDVVGIGAAKSGLLHASFGSAKAILRDLAIYASPSIGNTRKLIDALNTLSKGGTSNTLRAGESLFELLHEAKSSHQPPAPSPSPRQ